MAGRGQQEGVQGGEGSSRRQNDDWTKEKDPEERRKIQNRIAQRKFREREKQKRRDESGIAANQAAAGSAYAHPEAEDLEPNADPAGLPWGSVSLKHVFEAGKAKEKGSQRDSSRHSQRTSREPSTGRLQRPDDPSRVATGQVGLQLSEQWARGTPAWNHFGFNDFPNSWRGRRP